EKRHDVASVAISRGKLYTLNISTTDKRWNKVENKFTQVAKSFSVY
ncbi:MAG: photosystem II reaction center PsbP, partial [Microcoleaceae cyanobacterium]